MSFLVAVVVPERTPLEDWAEANNLSGDFKSLCKNGKARKYMLEELNSLGRKKKLRDSEMLRAVHLEPTPFDIERDLVTPTFKLKRPQLLKHYKICIYLTSITLCPSPDIVLVPFNVYIMHVLLYTEAKAANASSIF
ncbi:hypothetical protein AgCh_012029 [Apium graveolens]